MKIEYNGHVMEFSDSGAAEFEKCLMMPLDKLAPMYIKQELRDKATMATAEELRAAIVRSATEEMAMFNLTFKD